MNDLEKFQLDDTRAQQLRDLIDEVLRVNRQFNLTAIRDLDEAWTKHIHDSLQGLQTGLFEGEKTVIDVGAGAGFPGLALAVARPELQITLLDSTRKKCDFIGATAEKFNLNAKALNERAEIAGHDKALRESFDIATARAVGSLPEVCELALPFVKRKGHLVLWRGRNAREELQQSRRAIEKLGGDASTHIVLPYTLPGHEITYHIVVIPKHKFMSTPREFPRRVGLPKQKPL